jgi:hypothetical protein
MPVTMPAAGTSLPYWPHSGERGQLEEGAGVVEHEVDALAHQQLAAAAVALDVRVATARGGQHEALVQQLELLSAARCGRDAGSRAPIDAAGHHGHGWCPFETAGETDGRRQELFICPPTHGSTDAPMRSAFRRSAFASSYSAIKHTLVSLFGSAQGAGCCIGA